MEMDMTNRLTICMASKNISYNKKNYIIQNPPPKLGLTANNHIILANQSAFDCDPIKVRKRNGIKWENSVVIDFYSCTQVNYDGVEYEINIETK